LIKFSKITRNSWDNDNIKMYRKERGWESVEWIDLSQDMEDNWQGVCESGTEPPGSIKCRDFFF